MMGKELEADSQLQAMWTGGPTGSCMGHMIRDGGISTLGQGSS